MRPTAGYAFANSMIVATIAYAVSVWLGIEAGLAAAVFMILVRIEAVGRGE